MASGPRSRPPELPNFEYEAGLGAGGFADVFLYRQLRPSRQVAVKVLRTDRLDAEAQQAFDAEADLMARVSTHPYIVTIFGADMAPDGRPFLVMEYYPKPHYGRRCREQQLSVQEVLRVGVRIASAVETAHRAGILHRDIKPANILVNEYDRPGLTDFGIAGALGAAGAAQAQGATIAYGAPEVIVDGGSGDERTDVYSLGATLYALLTGSAPFEVRGGDNNAHALLQRTLRGSFPPIARDDVPRSLALLLEHAMARDPASRPPSAASLARSLQGIEQELRFAPTDLELAGAEPLARKPVEEEDDDATRARRVQVVEQRDGRTPLIASVPAPSQLGASPADVRVDPLPMPEAPAALDTVARPARVAQPESVPDGPSQASPPRRMAVGLAAVAAGVVLVVIVAVVFVARGSSSSSSTTTTTTVDVGALVIPDAPAIPAHVTVSVADGVATVTWDTSAAQTGDAYQVTRTDGAHADDGVHEVASPPFLLSGIAPGERVCVRVAATRGSRVSDDSPEACGG